MNVLLMPSYEPHLEYVINFAKSLSINCLDKNDTLLYVIVSEHEKEFFQKRLSEFKDLHIVVITLKQILNKFNINVNEGELTIRLGKYNFQTIKKIYAARYFNYNLALIIDSEAVLVKKCAIKELFANYKMRFYSPFITMKFQRILTENCFRILKKPCVYNWHFEYQNWFVSKNIIEELFDYIKETNGRELFDILLEGHTVFEITLYDIYLKYIMNCNYEFISTEDLLAEYLEEYHYQFKLDIGKLEFTPLEYLCIGIRNDNIKRISRMFEENNMNFLKLDNGRSNNLSEQIELVKMTKSIKMLACNYGYIQTEINGVFIK